MNLLLQLVEDFPILHVGSVNFQIEKLAVSIGLMQFLLVIMLESAQKYAWMMLVVL